jgi:catechol 2,3-dioxygenase-like lactoylglutathione lyase family enzyme
MLKSVFLSSIHVLDQQEALDFYVGKLGMQVTNDFDMGFMRWLTVGFPDDPTREVLLEVPAPPSMDPATAEVARELVAKGAGGGWLGFHTDNCQQTYEDLLAKGVDITQEPTEQFYGVDMGIRDPFGNALRITEPREFTPDDFQAWMARMGGPPPA